MQSLTENSRNVSAIVYVLLWGSDAPFPKNMSLRKVTHCLQKIAN